MKDNIVERYSGVEFERTSMSNLKKDDIVRFLNEKSEPIRDLFILKEDAYIKTDSWVALCRVTI